MKHSYIYALIDPRTKEIRYIGKSINPRYRLCNHLGPKILMSKNDNKSIWLRELVNLGLKPELKILVKCLYKNENYWERIIIAKYRKKGYDLTNMKDGGDGWQMSIRPDWSKRINKGALLRMRKVILKNVKTGKEMGMNSVKEAAEYIGVDSTRICALLKGKKSSRTAKGYYVRYEGTKFKEPNDNRHKSRPLIAINVDTGKKIHYNSTSEAVKDGFSARCIRDIVLGLAGRYTHKGYKFKYDQ